MAQRVETAYVVTVGGKNTDNISGLALSLKGNS